MFPPQGQITLPAEVLNRNTWKHTSELVMLTLGDRVVLRLAHYPKTDDISDLGGFFKNNQIQLSIEALCEPVNVNTSFPRRSVGTIKL
ncbi:MAG: AbrB/MazE/SpoVT family DNA-binding domain-containing protein [Methylovulum sp.]|nr:AbrB/MazE/SpoVT family DNA-binding domain-containing protein [Methylovulum sp.]